MKLAHLADLHLGFRQFDRQTPRGGNQREADVADAFRRAVDDLLVQRPDLIVFAGDIFHSVRPTNAAILFLFQQLQRIRVGLPDTPVVMIAGNHDTPRSLETGTILRLYEALGVEVVTDRPRRIAFPHLDCAVLAVPHEALAQADRPALRPEPGTTINVLVTHGQWGGVGEERGTMEYGGALLQRDDIAPAQWDYVALGHYHVTHQIEPNVWYAGSLDYVGPNPWGQLQDERERGRAGKGYLLVHLPGARVEPRPVAPPRRFVDLPTIEGAGLTATQLDAEIARVIAAAKDKIDDQVARLLVWNVARATARDLDHAAIRGYKARALNFHLDLRRPPETRREAGMGAPGRKQTLAEIAREFLVRRPLDAELNRETFVRLGAEYLDAVTHAEGQA
ncbi:MAG TPA: exonuclease SbcCD subunit D [Gemmatimonadales bacterium]|nr:exonuclease SbcCD subunit D [Gemmatimonadales bacterium]